MFLNVGYLKVICCCTELTAAEFSLSCAPLLVDSTDGYIVASTEDLTCVVIKYCMPTQGQGLKTFSSLRFLMSLVLGTPER